MSNIYIEVYGSKDMKTKMNLDDVLKYELDKMKVCIYGLEVVKAIAVLKRSELIKRVKNLPYASNHNRELYINENDINLITQCDGNLIETAINETKGIIAVNSNKAVDLYYTVNCGGGTANSENVLGCRINYLRKVLCRYCSGSFNEQIIKVSDIAEKLNILGISPKSEMKGILTDVLRDETGRIINLNVMGKNMTGDDFAKLINAQSSRVYFQEHSIIFKSIGEGPGLGICLEGAKNLSENGFGFQDIIKYYYTGIEFEYLDEEIVNKTLKGKRLIIDPGHGGNDTGNIYGNVIEKDINLIISLELEKKLKNIGAEVILTRYNDIDIPAMDRVKLINEKRCEVFISIHQNSFMLQGVNGVEAYCYNNDEDAIKISNYITSFISEDINTKNRGIKTGDYYLLRETKVSGLILECMYMSGNKDFEKYTVNNYSIISNAIFKGICKFYDIESY